MSPRVVIARVHVTGVVTAKVHATEGGHCQGACHWGWSLPGCMSLRVVTVRVHITGGGHCQGACH